MQRPSRLLLDTNVWINNYLGSRPGHDAARDLITFALERELELYFSVSSAADIFYLLKTEFKICSRRADGELTESAAFAATNAAWACVRNMRQLAMPVGLDASDCWYADKLQVVHPDFEDDLIMAAAQRIHASYLVTEDKALIQNAVVPCASPDRLLSLLQALEA
ncbi:type II toxin-antitoxin system VapC family toxin [Olsenella phocaeensis]|uniref:type II toxin-antitoxin system VapC family toxin n=1 Tax=Olsenella phocaeensis TaxID=1852385 RepID=UPI003A904504